MRDENALENGGRVGPLLANLDHIKPVSKGGEHTWENVAIACMMCNIRKGARTDALREGECIRISEVLFTRGWFTTSHPMVESSSLKG
jgi:hypothetical protein